MFSIITSTVLNAPSIPVQDITPSIITNNAYTSITFTATANAAYIGFGGTRTSGTLSLTISELSVVSGNPDTETGSLIAYKNINVVGGGGTGSPIAGGLSTCNIANNFTNTVGFDGILLKLDAGSQYNRLMKFGSNSVGNIIQGTQSADETQYSDIFLQPYGAAIIIGAGTGAGTTESLLNTYINSAAGAGLTSLAEFRNVDYTAGVRSFIRVRQGVNVGASSSSYFGTGQDGRCYIIANNSARNGDIVIDNNNGYVGIGTGSTAPGYKLDINSIDTYKTLMLRANAIGTRFDVALDFNAINVNTFPYARIGLQVTSASAGAEVAGLTFWTINNSVFSEKMCITGSGDIGIGVIPTAGNKLWIKGSSTSSGDTALFIENSTPSSLFLVRNDGLVGFPKINDFTTANAPNTWINPASSYGIYISTSSRRYKKDIIPYDRGLDIIKQLNPVYFKSKSSVVDGDKQFAGFIAEEIHDLGLTEFVTYIEDGITPNSVAYQNMVVLLTKAMQEQQLVIQSLTARIEKLENKS